MDSIILIPIYLGGALFTGFPIYYACCGLFWRDRRAPYRNRVALKSFGIGAALMAIDYLFGHVALIDTALTVVFLGSLVLCIYFAARGIPESGI